MEYLLKDDAGRFRDGDEAPDFEMTLTDGQKVKLSSFRLLFDAYHMKLCIYAVQLTDSFEFTVEPFFILFEYLYIIVCKS